MSGAAISISQQEDRKFDHLVYLRVFEGCNLHCEHCFIPSNPKKMSLDNIAEVPGIVRKFAKAGQRVLLQWHGGEPTVFGAKWVKSAIEIIEKGGPEFDWQHGIQTNLMTYGPEWVELYHHSFASEVGVSWDPEIRLLRKDKPETNADFEEKFWPNLERLVDDGLSPYMVMTGTKLFFEKFKNPFDLFDLLADKGVKRAHIERLTNTGYARDNWLRIGVTNAEYSAYMSRIARHYALWHKNRQPSENKLLLSPFEGLIESVESLGKEESKGYGCWSGQCDDSFHTIDSNGYKKGCTAINSEYDNKNTVLNEINVVKFIDLKGDRAKRQIDCKQCEFLKICSSGCLASEKEDGSGECSGGRELFKTIKQLAI